MECNFHVGQKVVCVDDAKDYTGSETKLRNGVIYEVEAVVEHLGFTGLVVAGAYSWHPTRAYRSSRFRPVVERKTDISGFKAMLNPSKSKVQA